LSGPLLVSLIAIVDFLDHHGEAFTGAFTILLAVFTGRLWFSTEKLWKITNDSVGLARDEFLSTHRPKIRIKHLWLTQDIWGKEQITVSLGIVNNGTSVATLNTVGIRFVIVRAGRPIPFDPSIPDIPGLNVAGQKMPVGVWWTFPNI
jgi:hypothetical protein